MNTQFKGRSYRILSASESSQQHKQQQEQKMPSAFSTRYKILYQRKQRYHQIVHSFPVFCKTFLSININFCRDNNVTNYLNVIIYIAFIYMYYINL